MSGRAGIRVRLAASLAAALLAALAALVLAGPAAAVYDSGDDWRHVESTIKELNRQPPSVPVVVLLGGSAARECITTEPAWSAQIAALGGGRVRALNFGSSSQAFKNGLTIVNALPAVPTIVLIGLNVGRYTSIPPESLPSAAPATGRGGGVYDSHRFHDGQQISDAAKRGIVRTWLRGQVPALQGPVRRQRRRAPRAHRPLPGEGLLPGAGGAPAQPADRASLVGRRARPLPSRSPLRRRATPASPTTTSSPASAS